MENPEDEKRKIAIERWKLLKKLLMASEGEQAEILSRPSAISKRSHGQFQLFNVESYIPQNGTQEKGFSWVQYLFDGKPLFNIRQITPKLTIQDFFSQFSGFLNTGNICIWPSEEILAWYIFENRELFRNKSICELGGGMAALAGVVASALCFPSKVVLTEGNPQCVSNLQVIIDENKKMKYFPENLDVSSRDILWDVNQQYQQEFDVILVADCLYAIEVQQSLLHVIKQTLNPKGKVFIMAPKRTPSFESFHEMATKEQIFDIEVFEKYSQVVSEKHQNFLQTDENYKENIHYPLLMILSLK